MQLVFPKLKSFGVLGVGCMHSKLQLLFHADYLRVVVPTVLCRYKDNSDLGEPRIVRLG